MAITITVNDTLTLDQTAGVQSPTDGNDISVTYSGNPADPLGGGLDAEFLTYLNGLGLSDAQKEYAALVDGASSGASFITIGTTADEEINDLFLSDANGDPLNGDLVANMETLANDPLYLHSDPSNSDFVLVTTSATAGAGRIVGVVYLDQASDLLSAQIQMVTFEAIQHPITSDPDDTLDLTDVLQVSAEGSLSFDFDQLESGNFLWAAIGSSAGGLLVTGNDLNLNDNAGAKFGNMIKGGSDPCDSVNTSQGGIGATIGTNAQHFVAGETMVFTLVTGYVPLANAAEATGIDIEEINYDGYINTSGAALLISQVSGGDADFTVSLWRAGGGTTPEEGFGYIGNQDSDEELHDDTAIDVATVTITRGTDTYVWALADSGDTQGGITVTFSANSFTVLNADAGDTVAFTSDAGDGDFNRFKVVGLEGTDAFDIGRVDIDKGITESEGVGADLLIDDDGPAIGNIPGSTVQFTTGATTGNVGLLDLPGTDGQASLQITDFTSSVTLLGKTIEGQINTAGTEVRYFEDVNNNDILDGSETHWYTLSISQNATSADFYNFTVVNAPAAPPLTFDFDTLPSGSNMFGSVADSPDGPGLFVFGRDVVLHPNNSGKGTNTSDVIHTSQGGIGATIGVNNQMFDGPDNDGAYFTFVNNIVDDFLSGVGGGLTSTEADDADNIQYTGGLHDTPSAFFGMSQGQGNELADLEISAFHLNSALQARALTQNSGTNQINITRVVVYDEFGAEIEDTDGSSDDGDITVDLSGLTATITNLAAGMKVEWYTATPHNQILVEAVTGKFDIGFFGFNEPQQTPDHFLDFEVTLTDGDGDSASDTFRIDIDAVPFV